MTDPAIPDHLAFPPVEPVAALQAHMRGLCAHFGWDKADGVRKFLLLVEETGELAKAIRKQEKLFQESGQTGEDNAARQNLADEFADVFSYLLDLANHYDVDLGAAYREKMTRNFSRQWL